MQPVIQKNPTCDQWTLDPIIYDYHASIGKPTSSEGNCYGLVLHHCVKHFEGDAFEHIRLIQRVCAEKLDGVTKSDELQKFCHTVVRYQDIGANSLREKIKTHVELDIHSSFHFTAPYSYNSNTKSFNYLTQLINLIASVSKTVEKYIFLHAGDHTLGISVKENSYSFYDPSKRTSPSIETDFSAEGFAPVVSHLAHYSDKLSLSLGIEVITNLDIQSSMNKCEALKQLQMEILKAGSSQGLFNHEREAGFSPFAQAMIERHFDSARDLHEHGADPDLSIGGHNPPIFQAVILDDFEAIDVLLGMKADINLCWSGQTALYAAARKGKLGMVQLLLNRGAKALKNNRDVSPQKAAWYNYQMLRQKGSQVSEEAENNAHYKDHAEIIRILNEAEPSLAYTEPLLN